MAFFLYSLFLVILPACESEPGSGTVVLPSNLTVNIINNNDGSGNVTVEASADKANFYTIYFGEDANEIPVKSTSGIANHKYSSSGDFTIRVLANTTASKFIEKETDVTITLAGDGEVVIPATGYTSPTSYDGMTLLWEDDFSGSSLNTSSWTFETGRGTNGWGNNELQYYRQENTKVEDGYLIITAKKENYSGAAYTSSRLKTQGKREFMYGRIDIRAGLPRGQGIWPALWMLGGNFSTTGWPACGEVDIMEMIGGSNREKTVHGTVHWDNNGSYASHTGSKTIENMLGDEFHVYSIVWNSTSITWYLDNVQFHVINTTPAALSEFHQQYFIIFNVAVGGNWPGSPDGTTSFPQHMIVDYIRVFQ